MSWNPQLSEINNTIVTRKHHQLPLARVKRIKKSNEEVKLVSSETPIVFSKACESFIRELTLRSWLHTEGNKRRTLKRRDIAGAIGHDRLLEFLLDVVPFDHNDSQKVFLLNCFDCFLFA
ncbi:nuclear transcription factor Y subunit C-2-like [Pyrus communis]|uniref:nuclear transcription factor Y subunit C-2-like n=1 Tax=Pyrus communis TaxID=23211 RepID=UPI0035C24D80